MNSIRGPFMTYNCPTSNLTKEYIDVKRSRLVIGALVVSAVVLQACGSAGDSGAETQTAAANSSDAETGESIPEGPGLEGPITLVDYGGETARIAKEVWIDPFSAATGVEVRQDAPNDYSKVKAQVDSGNISWNLIFVQPYRSIVDCGTYYEKLDTSKISTIGEIPDLVGECGLPIDNFAYIMVYDESKFGDNPPTSWADFFDTAKYPGKRGVSTGVAGAVLEPALLADGVAPDQLYPLDIDRSIAKWATIRNDLAFFDTGAEQMQQIESQEVVMSLAWHGRVQLSARNGAPFKPVWDQHLRTHDTVALIKGSPNQDAAYALMSYMTGVDGSTGWAEKTSYGAINANARPELDEIGQVFDANAPDHVAGAVELNLQWWADNYEEAIDKWTQWIAE